ncbi:MAG: hypothetical protein RIT32_291 [Actinomycetota bacterium]|jgi:competence protein ComEA
MSNLPSVDPRLLKIAAGVSGVSVLAAGVFWFQGRPTEIVPVEPVTVTESQTTFSDVFVHVVGEVKKPGVYDLPANSRVIDAIDAAGGATKDADLTSVNLARILFDGEQILIGNLSDPATSSSSSQNSATPGRVSINTATVSQLDQLPGIGPVIASRIIEYRQQNGPFRQLTDIKNVSGIGDALYDKIKDSISL